MSIHIDWPNRRRRALLAFCAYLVVATVCVFAFVATMQWQWLVLAVPRTALVLVYLAACWQGVEEFRYLWSALEWTAHGAVIKDSRFVASSVTSMMTAGSSSVPFSGRAHWNQEACPDCGALLPQEAHAYGCLRQDT